MDAAAPFVSDETSSLADSAYELISSTDGESQDGRGTESVTDSLDVYPRADDVHSLSGNDAGYDDDVDEESVSDNDGDNEQITTPSHSYVYDQDATNRRLSQTDSIQYAENVLGSPSTQSISNLDYDSSSGDGSTLPFVVPSIEFSEADICLDKVAVKHTIRDFGEAESAAIAAAMHMAESPRRLAATIRQTMSHHCLATHEPLKILYVGSDAAYSDIMYKISSALLASATHTRAGSESEHHSSTPSIYNIMPISSFGTSKVPEIDEIQLMGVSDYYINVERCVEAHETVVDGSTDAVYSIKLENDKTYASVFAPNGSMVHPPWSLPHVAVFYVSGNDDERTERTRNATWEFMTRHGVPSIFISHAQSLSRPSGPGRWRDFVDQAAVHLCLESRDPECPIVPERLPIDLASFLNIDARQMNRNLAYLTGLHEPSDDKTEDVATAAAARSARGYLAGVATAARFILEGNYSCTKATHTMKKIRQQLGAARLFTLALAGVSTLLWAYFFLLVPSMMPTRSGYQIILPVMPSSSAAGTGVHSASTASSAVMTTTSACSIPSLTPTITISLTSTTTVQMPVSSPSSSTVQFGGFLTDRANQQSAASVSNTQIKRTGCSIQVYSGHEILVKVPSATKTMWLAKGAIDIDVWRGQELLKSRLSTTDEGIIIEIGKKDAYGVMNVAIVTTRRPKINETFAVDFGKPTMLRQLSIGMETWLSSVQTAVDSGLAHPYVGRMAGYVPEARKAVSSLFCGMKQVSRDAVDLGGQLGSRLSARLGDRLANSVECVVSNAIEDARAVVDAGLQPLSRAQGNAQLTVLRAQIASKLWWMRVNGKMAEYADYEAKAAQFLCEAEKAVKAAIKAAGKMADKTTKQHGVPGTNNDRYAWIRSFGKKVETQAVQEQEGRWRLGGCGGEARG